MNQLPSEFSKRFIAVLNKKIPVGKLMNALGHMTAGMVSRYPDTEAMCFLDYVDSEEGVHPTISHFPFIILQAKNSSQIRTLRQTCIQEQISFADFVDTMTVGTSAAQLERTKETPEAELEYFGIVMFGETEQLGPHTKKFSLFS